MEGKSVLFKRFADIDYIDIEINNNDANNANQEGNSQTPGIPTIKVNISFRCYGVELIGLGFDSISNINQITDR